MGKRKAALSGQLADLDLKLLRVFKAVVESGGFSSAEVELNLANSTISNYISDLEKRLDMRLCNRGRGGFSLTDHGHVVYEATQDLLSAVDQFRNRVNISHERILGHLHLGFAEHMLSAYHSCVIEALRLYTEKAPDVRVRIISMASDDVVPAVQEGRVQLGITVMLRQVPELDVMRLFDEEMSLYCAENHPLYAMNDKDISVEKLQTYKFVESPRLMPGREIDPITAGWNKHASAHHQEVRAALILTGHYLGFLPKHLVHNWGWQHKMRPLLEGRFNYINSFSAISKPYPKNDLVISTFMDCLKEAVISSQQ
ncbi:LysR family transcriptional regulator [Sessilibacter corallicola]|uniref:LysR family transcriptional regulator n=1 Tax=Sessilibacter corallicola TaxID=2904075 RepID=UPI001E4CCBED|nr:LysR family transcriptional regulator [Sessilibacter corallicola]MCE2029807.1 LysR family transcriptional regulator [Sessilibacter corallicola]